MTPRAVALGVLLALAIASLTYLNDHVVRQTFLLNHHLPAPVFVTGVLLVLAVNPLLVRVRRRPFDHAEVGLVLALGLAVCAWPGTSYFRSFTHRLALPAFRAPVEPSWQATNVLAYLPGAHGRLAEGHLRDHEAIQRRLMASTVSTDPAANSFLDAMDPVGRARLGNLTSSELAAALEAVLRGSGLADRFQVRAGDFDARVTGLLEAQAAGRLAADEVVYLNRLLLEAVFSESIIPLRRGRGVLPAEGELDPRIVEPLVAPGSRRAISPEAVPWRAWWPALRLWGGVTLATALAVLCLMLVVHPQWSQRELLSYPTVQLVQAISRTDGLHRMPSIMRSRLFWIGVTGVIFLHTINGLHAWFPALPQIQRQFNFAGLGELFPTASRMAGFSSLVRPTLFPIAIGFAFLIPVRTAMGVGMSLPMWVVMSATLAGFGITASTDRYDVDSMGPSLRVGAYAAVSAMIVFFGRHYYARVVQAAFGITPSAALPAYAPAAARGLVIFGTLAVFLLWHYGGLDWWLGAILVLMVMMASLVLARINAETGLFYVQPEWYPVMMMVGLLNSSVLGPELLIVLVLASMLMMPEPREGLAPYLINGLRLADPAGDASPRQKAPLIAVVMIGGFVVALIATLTVQYSYGLNLLERWSPEQPRIAMGFVSGQVAEMNLRGELQQAIERTSLQRPLMIRPSATMLLHVLIGAGLALGCSLARLRLPWWPIHPVVFLIWGTWPSNFFAASFLFAVAVKWAVIHTAGQRGYTTVKPLMLGLIVGDLVMIAAWAIVGGAYFAYTGLSPRTYMILPN